MNRSPLRRGRRPSRWIKMRGTSKKRRSETRQYIAVRNLYLQNHPYCEAQACGQSQDAGMAVNASTQIHHKRGRSGPALTDIRFFMAVCAECHEWIERNRQTARACGWLLTRDAKAQRHQGIS